EMGRAQKSLPLSGGTNFCQQPAKLEVRLIALLVFLFVKRYVANRVPNGECRDFSRAISLADARNDRCKLPWAGKIQSGKWPGPPGRVLSLSRSFTRVRTESVSLVGSRSKIPVPPCKIHQHLQKNFQPMPERHS